MKHKKEASSAPSCLHPHPNSHSLGATTLKTFRHFIWYLLNSSRYFVYTITSYYFKCKHYLWKMKTQCLQRTLSHISPLPAFQNLEMTTKEMSKAEECSILCLLFYLA